MRSVYCCVMIYEHYVVLLSFYFVTDPLRRPHTVALYLSCTDPTFSLFIVHAPRCSSFLLFLLPLTTKIFAFRQCIVHVPFLFIFSGHRPRRRGLPSCGGDSVVASARRTPQNRGERRRVRPGDDWVSVPCLPDTSHCHLPLLFGHFIFRFSCFSCFPFSRSSIFVFSLFFRFSVFTLFAVSRSFVRACVRACMRACVRACVRAFILFACLLACFFLCLFVVCLFLCLFVFVFVCVYICTVLSFAVHRLRGQGDFFCSVPDRTYVWRTVFGGRGAHEWKANARSPCPAFPPTLPLVLPVLGC